MAKSKLTLIVDGNWLLMSRLAVLNNKYDSADELIKNVKKMLIKSINIALRTFEDIDNRIDYIPCFFHIIKFNLEPFFTKANMK